MGTERTKSPVDVFHSVLRQISLGLALAVFLASSVIFLLWAIGHPQGLEFATQFMKLNTSLGLITGSVTLILLNFVEMGALTRTQVLRVARVLGAAVFLLGAALVIQHHFSLSLGLDQWLFSEAPSALGRPYPGRISVGASWSFVLLGLLLHFLISTTGRNSETDRPGSEPFQTLAIVLFLFSILSLLGHLFGVREQLAALGGPVQMSAVTAACFLFLSTGSLLLHPQKGWMKVLTNVEQEGREVRRLFVIALLIPPVIGHLRTAAYSAGWFDDSTGRAITVVTYMVLYSLLIFRTGKRMLEGAAEKLMLIKTRDDFLSIASHELKTPLTSLKLQTQMHRYAIDQGDVSATSPDRLRIMQDKNERQVDRLTRLVEDMLDISRINSGKLSLIPEQCNLSQVVREVQDRLSGQIQASRSDVTLELREPLYGVWDRQRLEQVVQNLITNALKYGLARPIRIRTRVESRQALLEVMDEGLGISSDNLTRIFQRFERAAEARNISGLGLGLFIVRQIVELHQGTIEVESKLGEGSTFRVRLPLSR